MKYNWKVLLESIEQSIVNSYSNDSISILYPNKPDTILNPPATLQNIQELESKLGLILPTSYKEFLLTSNGLKILSTTYWDIFSANEVKLLKECDPDLIEIWNENDFEQSDEEYFVYGEDQNSTSLRGSYMKHCIAVSGWGDSAIILLNPEVKFDDEWEAWAFANWYPGAYRYKSFWDLVKSEFETSLEEKDI